VHVAKLVKTVMLATAQAISSCFAPMAGPVAANALGPRCAGASREQRAQAWGEAEAPGQPVGEGQPADDTDEDDQDAQCAHLRHIGDAQADAQEDDAEALDLLEAELDAGSERHRQANQVPQQQARDDGHHDARDQGLWKTHQVMAERSAGGKPQPGHRADEGQA